MDYTKDALVIQELAEERLWRQANVSQQEIFRNVMDMLNSTNDSGLERGEFYGNETEFWVPYSERPETYIVPIIFAITFVVGVLGNGTLIRIFMQQRQMRNVPNMYICSLAVGDLLVILFCVPFTSTVYTVESWPYGVWVCKFSEFIKDVSIGVSVFTLTALSADRYFAIIDPMGRLPGRRATRITCFTIAGIWILSMIIALPSVLYSYVKIFDHEDLPRPLFVCYPFPEEFGPSYPKMVVLLKFLVYYAVPLLFIATFYIFMAKELVLSTRNIPGEAEPMQTYKQTQGRKKVAKMVLSFVVIFALCFFPSHLFFLWFYFYPDSDLHFNAFWNILRILGFCLTFFNSCINPITLYCVSGTFRKQFNRHLFCCICSENRHPFERCGCGGVSVSLSMYNDRVMAFRNGNSIRFNSQNSQRQSLPLCNFNSQGVQLMNGNNNHFSTTPMNIVQNNLRRDSGTFSSASFPESNTTRTGRGPICTHNRRCTPAVRGPTTRINSHVTCDAAADQDVSITSFINISRRSCET